MMSLASFTSFYDAALPAVWRLRFICRFQKRFTLRVVIQNIRNIVWHISSNILLRVATQYVSIRLYTFQPFASFRTL